MDLVHVALAVLIPGVSGLLAWVWRIDREQVAMRIAMAERYHDKDEIDAIVERVTLALSRQIKAEIAPLIFRIGEISRKLNIPPEISRNDP